MRAGASRPRQNIVSDAWRPRPPADKPSRPAAGLREYHPFRFPCPDTGRPRFQFFFASRMAGDEFLNLTPVRKNLDHCSIAEAEDRLNPESLSRRLLRAQKCGKERRPVPSTTVWG